MEMTTMRRSRTVGVSISCMFLVQLLAVVTGQDADNQLQYVTNEEAPPSVFVGNIPEDSNLRDQVPDEAYSQLTYSILSSSSPFARHFSLGRTDGILRIASVIDRDNVTFCYQKILCKIKLDIAVQPREYFRIIKVTVIVEDINDNLPAFLESHFQRSLSENTNPGASFTIPTADDPDSPKYGVKRYELVSGNENFDLKVTNTSDGSMDLHLVLKNGLDREERDLYQVVVAAYDGGIPPNMGTLTADIIVQDVNDNYPVFDNETYNIVVSENTEVNQVIVRVHAKDPDMGPNGQIVYSFSSKTQQRYGSQFAIHNASGEITLKQPLHYQDGSMYTLTVTARDNNPESLTTLAKVLIQVEDVNNNAPQITVNALTSSGSVEISEGNEPGGLVAHISVEDADSGAGGQFVCDVDSPTFTIQQLYGGIEYKVVTSQNLDREETGSYNINFICNDLGDPSLTSTAQISVTVLDENDNPPVFSQNTYTAILEENGEIGAYVTTISATDVDLLQSGEVEYRALGDANNLIAVDSISGDITTKVSFDYENNQRLEIPVIAVDHGDVPLTATATLILSFTDVDDSKPEFTQEEFTFMTHENQPMGTEVGQVIAIDADSVPYNDFTYFLSPTELAYDSFVLDEQNGKIFTKKSLDRESEDKYSFTVKAVTKQPPLRSSSTVVNVVVLDKNDHYPYCTFPNIKKNTAFIVRVMSIGEHITALNCTDDDSGINSKLGYKFLTNNHDDLFGIEEETGVIYAKSKFDDIREESFPVLIQISDSGDKPKTIDVTLNLVVNKSMSEDSMMSKENLTIVVSVAVCSAILVVVLIVAIVIVIRKKDKKKRKYVDKKILVAADVNKANIPVRKPRDEGQSPTATSSNDAGKGQSYTNGISLKDERLDSPNRSLAPAFPQQQTYPVTNYNKVPSGYNQYKTENTDNSSPYSHGHGHGHGYGIGQLYDSAIGNSYSRNYLQVQDHNSSYASSTPYVSAVDGPYHEQHHHDNMEEGVWPLGKSNSTIKESDSESNHSAPASNSDSGRGSNEDADSVPAPLQHNNSRDGVVLYPRPYWSKEEAPVVPSSSRSNRPPVPSRPVRHSSYKDTLQLHGRAGRNMSSDFPMEHHQRYGSSFRDTHSHNRDYDAYEHTNYRREHNQPPRVYLEDSYNNRRKAKDRPVHYVTASQV